MESEVDSQSTERSADEKEVVIAVLSDKQHRRPVNGPAPNAGHAHDDAELFETEIDSVDEDDIDKEGEEEYEVLDEEECEQEIEELVEEEVEPEAEYVDEEELDDIEDEEREENGLLHEIQHVEKRVERVPTQVPKKRKIPIAAEENALELKDTSVDANSNETRRSGAQSAHIDEHQCRVCTTKVDLVSLFKTIEKKTVADMLMSICPNVSIARKDFMPQYICNTCLDNVTIAVQLKTQCETTERELRKQLPRGKNKYRRRPAYLIVDATPESDPATDGDDELNDDAEFKMSDEFGLTGDDDSADSDFSAKRKKPVKTGRKRGRPRKNPLPPAAATTTTTVTTVKREYNTMARKNSIDLDPDFSSNDERQSSHAKKARTAHHTPDDGDGVFPCDQCDNVYSRRFSLLQHMKAHSNREPIECEICGKQFKIAGAYRTHMQKHKMDVIVGHKCDKCSKIFPTKAEMRVHLVKVHNVPEVVYQCNKCKRTFLSEVRLAHHQENTCRTPETIRTIRRAVDVTPGPDLFKSVAPMTTTYWSDSFSD